MFLGSIVIFQCFPGRVGPLSNPLEELQWVLKYFNQQSASKGPFPLSINVNAAMTLAILLWSKTIKLLQNGLQPQSGATTFVFNQSSVASFIAAVLLTLGVNGS